MKIIAARANDDRLSFVLDKERQTVDLQTLNASNTIWVELVGLDADDWREIAEAIEERLAVKA